MSDWSILAELGPPGTLTRQERLARPDPASGGVRPSQQPARPVEADWRALAECRGLDPELFFPERGEDGVNSGADAKAVCARCPVQAACLAHALEVGEKHGIWGGKSERQRRTLRGAVKTRVCAWCSTRFLTSTGGGPVSYCSDDCRKAARAHPRVS